MADVELVGRDSEIATVRDFLHHGSTTSALLIGGEAGIGKSTLWALGVSLAQQQGITVLSVRPAQAEAKMSFAGLTDLFDAVADELLPRLTGRSRPVLETAMLRRVSAGAPADEREVGAAVRAALHAVTSSGPILVAIDDVQWLDRASAEALAFALRRLTHESVRILLTCRTGDSGSTPESGAVEDPRGNQGSAGGPGNPGNSAVGTDPAGPADVVLDAIADRLAQVMLRPLPEAAVAELLRQHDVRPPSRAAELELIAASRGNPYWVLELVRAYRSSADGHRTMTIPTTLTTLLNNRWEASTPDVQAVVLVVAAQSLPTLGSVSRALSATMTDPEAAIDAAVTAGVVVESAGRLRPAHPLLGSHALTSLPPGHRRRLHRRLAEVAADPEQRARHLALASDGEPDNEVAAVVETGVLAARSRGARLTAANLADLAIGLTPPADRADLARRRLLGATLYFAAGNLVRACELAEDMARSRPAVAEWPDVLPLLVEATYWVRGQPAAQAVVRAVLDDTHLDLRCRAVALACAADVGDGRESSRADLARESIELFDRTGGDTDPGALSMALVYLAEDHLDSGRGMDTAVLERAIAAEDRQQLAEPRSVPVLNRVRSIRAYQMKLVDDLDGARTALLGALAVARDEADDTSVPALLGHLALTEYWAGNFQTALARSDEAFDRIDVSGGVAPATLYSAASLSAVMTGDPQRGRNLIAGQLAPETAALNKKSVVYQHVLGVIDLLDGHLTPALEHFERAWAAVVALGIREPGRRQRLEGDLGQALVSSGQLDRAAELAAGQRSLGARLGRPTLLGIGFRLDGLVAAARGDLAAAVECLDSAVLAHRSSPLALELPRSLLALGQVHRRRRAKPLARINLQQALDRFTALGAVPWMAIAADELGRLTGGRTGATLTATEERVAALAGAGRNNREIAAAMFVSTRTVEGHLATVYRKLAIRGRSELGSKGP